jgi:hypothetical protein
MAHDKNPHDDLLGYTAVSTPEDIILNAMHRALELQQQSEPFFEVLNVPKIPLASLELSSSQRLGLMEDLERRLDLNEKEHDEMKLPWTQAGGGTDDSDRYANLVDIEWHLLRHVLSSIPTHASAGRWATRIDGGKSCAGGLKCVCQYQIPEARFRSRCAYIKWKRRHVKHSSPPRTTEKGSAYVVQALLAAESVGYLTHDASTAAQKPGNLYYLASALQKVMGAERNPPVSHFHELLCKIGPVIAEMIPDAYRPEDTYNANWSEADRYRKYLDEHILKVVIAKILTPLLRGPQPGPKERVGEDDEDDPPFSHPPTVFDRCVRLCTCLQQQICTDGETARFLSSKLAASVREGDEYLLLLRTGCVPIYAWVILARLADTSVPIDVPTQELYTEFTTHLFKASLKAWGVAVDYRSAGWWTKKRAVFRQIPDSDIYHTVKDVPGEEALGILLTMATVAKLHSLYPGASMVDEEDFVDWVVQIACLFGRVGVASQHAEGLSPCDIVLRLLLDKFIVRGRAGVIEVGNIMSSNDIRVPNQFS